VGGRFVYHTSAPFRSLLSAHYSQPTNHLDLAAIRWLTDLIRDRRKMTLLTVTHDRAFLEDVCDSILELDRGQFYSYDGSYSSYLRGKEERLANEDQAYRVAKGRYKTEREFAVFGRYAPRNNIQPLPPSLDCPFCIVLSNNSATVFATAHQWIG
jgi:energy-coupling factor transporter ATP-binding protein EcfA2